MARTAPLDLDAVAATARPLDEARMLPAAAYLDPAVLTWEREHLLGATWTCAGRAETVRAGQQAAVAVAGTSVLVTRDAVGTVHALANVCRHRGHELLPVGRRREHVVLQCPYHAWTYELDGRLRTAPHLGPRPAGCDDLGLVPLRHAEWGGWLFVDLGGGAPELLSYVGGLAEVLRPWRTEELVVAAAHTYAVDANWKLVLENYHECLHCPLIHPELCRVSPPTSGNNFGQEAGAWLGGTMDLAADATTMSLTGGGPGAPLRGLDATRRRQVLYVGLGWDLLISAHPDYVLTHRVVAVDPGHTTVECQWLFSREAVASGHFDPSYAVNFWDLTNRQDWSAVESVQRGIASPAFRPGPFAPSEDAVHRLAHRIASAYLGQ
jgi:Rieske 2Fe-2S family protein